MSTRLLLTASAIVLGVAGLAGIFAPDEVIGAIGAVNTRPLRLIIELFGAAFFGFALVNWSARGSLIGGIYNRPLALGNVAHFVIGAFASSKAGIWPAAIVYAIFAVAFGRLFFWSPVKQ
ncbi:MAG: hypothetical protein M3Q69_11630 [Acidobacteriota bacterium]|nr:hypothetical protein [Acidobacteriota bacterium]